ncbi:response regulator [candidate division KSB1 bacterium]|nr:response regulator [candidate division KSB1 bacterium]
MTQPYRLLLVDDDPLVLSGFHETLLREGYDIVTAATGREAVERLERESFDVVLTDLLMPKVSGLDVVRCCLKKHPDSIVIVVTGFASVRSAVEALRLGAYDYLVKPCEDQELIYRVKMGIERVQLQRDLRTSELDAEKMRAIAQTAVTVNDQINTPLNVILNSAEYIRLNTLPDSNEVRQSLDFITQEVSKIKGVIQRLARIAEPQTKEYSGGKVFMVDVERSGQRTINGGSPHQRRRILVVDDEQFMVHTLTKILDMMGFDVIGAFGGREAYELFLSQPVDLVVSDVHMPDMSGLDLLASIKTQNPAIPVILVTGYGVERASEIIGKCKADGFLGKPFQIQELKAIIDQTLGLHLPIETQVSAYPHAGSQRGVA